MKKLLPLLFIPLIFGSINSLKAQCYGYVKYDNSANSNGNSTFNITTSHSDDLILIAYNGWPGGNGTGPVTVDGNSATKVTSYFGNFYSGEVDVYCYTAAVAGTHTIVCTEGYNSPYYLNLAAAFYDSATCTPLSCSSVTTTGNSVNTNGITIVTPITTTTPNELIFSTGIFNTGISNPYSIADTGATATATLHVSIGLDANVGYTSAPTASTYTVTMSDPNTCVSCGGAVALIAMIPGSCSAAFSLSDSIISPTCVGNNGKIYIKTNGGTSPFTYLWSPGGATTSSITGLSAGNYVVTVTSADGACSTIKDTIKLTAPAISIKSVPTKCVPSNTGSATVNIANGYPPFTYLWSNGSTKQTISALPVGKYVITVTDINGCKLKDSVNITTYPPPVIKATPVSDSICYGSNVNLLASGGKTYTWLPARDMTCYNCANPTATPPISTIYTVTGTDTDGCTNTATVNLTIIPLPKPIVTGPDTICIGSSATLDVTGASTYIWNPGAQTGTTVTVRPPVTTTYTVKATSGFCTGDTTFKLTVVPVPVVKIKASKDSVCAGDTLTLSGSGATTYRWTPGNSTSKTIHVNVANTTTYTLHGYGGTCSDSASITIKAIQPITATISSSSDSICPGQSVTIITTVQGGNATYLWSNGATTSSIVVHDTVTTTHTVVVSGACNSLPITKTIVVVPLPKPTLTGERTRCFGEKDTLTVTSSVNPTTYVWSNGQTGTSFVSTNITSNTIITMQAFNSLGCSVTDTFNVTVIPYPNATITYPEGCGNTVITANATGSGTLTYKWSTGGTYDTINFGYPVDTATLSVVISNDGCSITKTVTVIKDMPTMSACCDATIFFGGSSDITAGGGNIISYQWTPPNSDLNCYTCANVVATPTVTTTYTVVGTDTAGCQIERTVTIIVETECFDFAVPNVFTPDNTGGTMGLDNIFYINTKNLQSWSLLIFDRWGHEVYKSSNPAQYWDGTSEGGGKAPEGVYYYVISAKCQNNNYDKKGFVQLIR